MKIKISRNNYNYLIGFLIKEKQDGFVNFLISNNSNHKYVYINLDEHHADEIRDWIGEKLQQIGFDNDYNLNQDGEILQKLEDIFLV